MALVVKAGSRPGDSGRSCIRSRTYASECYRRSRWPLVPRRLCAFVLATVVALFDQGAARADGSVSPISGGPIWRNDSPCTPSTDPLSVGRCGIAYVNSQPVSNFNNCTIAYSSATRGTVTCTYIPNGNRLSNGGPVYSTSSAPTFCPANSILRGSSCVCSPGFTSNPAASSCVRVVTQPDSERPPTNACADPASGNPIHPVRGTKRETISLGVQLAGLELQLTYDTARRGPRDNPNTDLPDAETMGFGELWSSTLHRRMILEQGGHGARVLRGDGTTVSFRGSGTGIFTPQASSSDRLLIAGAEYRFIDASQQAIERYDAAGKLLEIQFAGGLTLAFVYSDASTASSIAPGVGYLVGVSDSFGRTVGFQYTLPSGADPSTGGRVSRITDPAGAVTTFEYGNQNLTRITWPDLTTRQFVYENTAFPWALTGVVSESQARLSTFGYDTQGRAVSTESAGGVNRFSTSYGTAPLIAVTDVYDATAGLVRRTLSWQPPAGTSVIQPNGSVSALGVGIAAGAPAVVSRSQPAGAGCGAASSSLSYDSNGNLAGRDDFNGIRSCYASDPVRNLENARVEGLATTQICAGVLVTGAALPAGSRKTTTAWHPDWNLPVRRAEPGRITSWVYNGQPDPFVGGAMASCAPAAAVLTDGKPIAVLCRQVDQATTDSDGAQGFNAALQAAVPPRTQGWTYNAAGQIATYDGPRTDASDITSYQYYTDTTTDHRAGDRRSETNALGHTTLYTRYDRSGKLLESVDPNGVITRHTYDARQRLTSTAVGTELTTLAYDAAGQLVRVTQGDGAYIEYTYDAAQRPTGWRDSLGNRLLYTLDAAGNRTAEMWFDPGGTLRGRLLRVFDALGRVQQTTGQE